jgi:hypothetical protein
MGLSIGQTAASVAAATPVNLASANRRSTSSEDDAAGRLGRPQGPEQERVLSVAGAALRTLDTNFEAARTIVPSLGELRENSRVERAVEAQQRAEDAVATEEATPEAEVPAGRIESVRPEASPQVRNFAVDDSVTAAVSLTDRPEGAAGPAPQASTPSRIDVLI